jgi:NADPH:quinone reductase-like Zn-dependent oxidoreductase
VTYFEPLREIIPAEQLEKMHIKAIVYTKYGPPDVLQLREVEKPTPEKGRVLVKVHAASVNYSNTAFVSGRPFLVRLMGSGLLKPKYNINK